MADTDSWYAMPPDLNTWQNIIISNLARKIPEIPRYITGIDLPKLDPVAGDADGLVHLLNDTAAIPVVIRGCRLAPLDVMITQDDNFLPVTESFLQKLYASNIIGEPGMPPTIIDDMEEEGPARRVKRIQTVTQSRKYASEKVSASEKIKSASVKTRDNLRRAIISSVKVASFMKENRPNVVEALNPKYDFDLTSILQKAASLKKISKIDEIHYLSHEGDSYYFNGKEVSPSQAGRFLKVAGFSNDEKKNLLNGGCVCLDHREKHASVIFDMESEKQKEKLFPDSSPAYKATVLGLDGVPYRGILLRKERSSDVEGRSITYLFVTDDFHAVQNDIKIIDSEPISFKDIIKSSMNSEPQANMYGIIVGEMEFKGPYRIGAVTHYGNLCTISTEYDGIGNSATYVIGENSLFYEIPEDRKSLMRHDDNLLLSTEGKTYNVKMNSEGDIVLSNEVLSYGNALYKLMRDYSLSMDDAIAVGNRVKDQGSVLFKVAEDAATAIRDIVDGSPLSQVATAMAQMGSSLAQIAPQLAAQQQGQAPQGQLAPQGQQAPQEQILQDTGEFQIDPAKDPQNSNQTPVVETDQASPNSQPGGPVELQGAQSPDQQYQEAEMQQQAQQQEQATQAPNDQASANQIPPQDPNQQAQSSQPVELQGTAQPVEEQVQQVDQNGQPVGEQATQEQVPQLDPNGQPLDSNGQPLDSNGQQMDPSMQQSGQQVDQNGQPIDPSMQQSGQQVDQNGQPIQGQGPIQFDDIQDIAKINDPQLMDSYLTGKLTNVNTSGREEIMGICDDVLESIKSLGKLLFRVRLGQIDYVKESDVQIALSKMSEIASAIGLSSDQVTPQVTQQQQQQQQSQDALAPQNLSPIRADANNEGVYA